MVEEYGAVSEDPVKKRQRLIEEKEKQKKALERRQIDWLGAEFSVYVQRYDGEENWYEYTRGQIEKAYSRVLKALNIKS